MLREPESELVLDIETWLVANGFFIFTRLFDRFRRDYESSEDFSAEEVPSLTINCSSFS